MTGLRNHALFWGTVFAVIVIAQLLQVVFGAGGPDLSAITGALSGSESEIRGSIFPAVVGILTAILLISIAAGVVHIISRNR